MSVKKFGQYCNKSGSIGFKLSESNNILLLQKLGLNSPLFEGLLRKYMKPGESKKLLFLHKTNHNP